LLKEVGTEKILGVSTFSTLKLSKVYQQQVSLNIYPLN